MVIDRKEYVNIPGWALGDLKLKGNELLVFSIIYRFSGNGQGCFYGTLEYLATWTNSSEARMCKILDSLVKKELIIKGYNEEKRGPQYIVNLEKISNIIEKNSNNNSENLNESIEKSSNNNIDNNIDNNINSVDESSENIFIKKENTSNAKEILTYFNNVCGTHFKLIDRNLKHISGRLSEGFTVDDFKKVIDIKWLDWGKRPYKFHNGSMSNNFLRPQTLFGNKFENYLNEAKLREIKVTNVSVSSSEEEEESELTF